MLHEAYVAQVLRSRGVTPPAPQRISQFLAALGDREQADMAARVRRIALGVDEGDEIELLLAELRRPTAMTHSAEVTVNSAQQRAAPQRGIPVAAERPSRAVEPAPPRSASIEATQFLRANGLHVYGKTAALKVELDQLGPKGASAYTLQIEGARKSGGGYEWAQKIQFQLTRQELPRMAAFLLGYSTQQIEFSNHGPAHDKALFLHDQGRHLFVRLRQGIVIPVPVEASDAFAWGELCLLALHLNRPQLPVEAQLAMLRRIGRMEASAKP